MILDEFYVKSIRRITSSLIRFFYNKNTVKRIGKIVFGKTVPQDRCYQRHVKSFADEK